MLEYVPSDPAPIEKETVFFEGKKIGEIEREKERYQFSGYPAGELSSGYGYICGAPKPTKDEAIRHAIECACLDVKHKLAGIEVLKRAMGE